MNRLRRSSPLGWLAIVALLWHALMPLAHAMHGGGGMFMTLCTAEGSRVVFMPDDDGPTQPFSDVGASKCPLCAPGSASWALPAPPSDTRLIHAAALGHVLHAPKQGLPSQSPLQLHFSPRAPPSALI